MTMISEILAILFYGIGDLLTTKIGINMDIKEYNPLIRTILRKTGFTGFIIFKSVIISMIMIYLPTTLWIIAGIGIWLTVWNTNQILNVIKDQKK
jgi:hypothetical protein